MDDENKHQECTLLLTETIANRTKSVAHLIQNSQKKFFSSLPSFVLFLCSCLVAYQKVVCFNEDGSKLDFVVPKEHSRPKQLQNDLKHFWIPVDKEASV
jgi:hypothetical protein